MPYKRNDDLPESVRKVLPKRAQSIFRKAFNNAYFQYGKEEVRAFRVAWAAAKKAYRKDEKTGKWKEK